MPPAETVAGISAADWLRFLYSDADTGWVNLMAIDRETGEKILAWAPASEAETLGAQAEELAATACVWFGVATRSRRLSNGQRGGAGDCELLPGLWLDLDIADDVHGHENLPADRSEALDIIARFPLAPTAVIDSGHGLQAWWLFDELTPVAQVAPIMGRWRRTWERHAGDRHVDNVFDVARIMRLPGTWNRKADPVPVEVISADWERLYRLGELVEVLDNEPPPAAAAPVRQRDGGSPGDVYNRRHNGAEILDGLGFVEHHRDGQGTHFTRPGKDPRDGASATVYSDGHITIWSDSVKTRWPAIETMRPYDPFGLYTATAHAGDHTAAAKTLQGLGYGQPAAAAWCDLGAAAASPNGTGKPAAADLPPVIAADFWDTRATLTRIRTAARSWIVAPDALLGSVLARIAAQDHTLKVGTYGTRTVGLTFYSALLGNPGTGKSSAMAAARRVIAADNQRIPEIGTGSGEGFAETLFGWEKDENGDKHKVRTKWGLIATIDEGAKLFELAARGGFTLGSVLRAAWTDEQIGDANAAEERRRVVAPGTYSFGVTVGLQPDRIDGLLAEADVGTPQRFLWCATTDPNAPTVLPEWPEDLTWTRHAITANHHDANNLAVTRMALPAHASAEFIATQQGRTRGEIVANPLEVHTLILQAKAAGLLARLEERFNITTEDWELAGTLTEASNQVREWATHRLTARKEAAREAARNAAAADAEAAEENARARALTSAVRSVAKKIAVLGEANRRDLTLAVAGKHRTVVSMDEIIDEAEARGLITRTSAGTWGLSE